MGGSNVNNLREGLIWYAAAEGSSTTPEAVTKALEAMTEAAFHRALVRLAALSPNLLEVLKESSAEKDEFTSCEQPDPIRFPNPWSSPPVHSEVAWWPLYDTKPLYPGEICFFQVHPMGKQGDFYTNTYGMNALPGRNQFALYEVEVRFKNKPDFYEGFTLRVVIENKTWIIAPSDNMWVKASAPHTWSIGIVKPIIVGPHSPFDVRINIPFVNHASPPNSVRVILNGYRLRDIQ